MNDSTLLSNGLNQTLVPGACPRISEEQARDRRERKGPAISAFEFFEKVGKFCRDIHDKDNCRRCPFFLYCSTAPGSVDWYLINNVVNLLEIMDEEASYESETHTDTADRQH